jgi:lysophospholipase L1-like esterase
MEKWIRNLWIGTGIVVGAAGLAYLAFYVTKKQKLSQKQALPTSQKLSQNGNYLFVGDSYTAGNNSYADQLKAMYPGINITKIAQVGMKTDWMLQNAAAAIQSGNYDAVFILGGINDIYATNRADMAENNLQAMYDLAHAAGEKVVGITIAPTDYYASYDATKGSLTNDLNNWIMSIGTPDAAIDFNAMLKSGGKQDLSLFNPDKLHANTQGHGLLASAISQNLFE